MYTLVLYASASAATLSTTGGAARTHGTRKRGEKTARTHYLVCTGFERHRRRNGAHAIMITDRTRTTDKLTSTRTADDLT